MTSALTLAIDVGTGSVRAALVDGIGQIAAIAAREHDQIVPRFGWAEQRPADWWDGVVATIRTVLKDMPDARSRIAVVVACGQMHGTVLVDGDGRLARERVPLWNDKRTIDLVNEFDRANAPETYLAESGNPPTPAWPGFKLAWLRDNDPEAYARATHVIMPKDYINLKLTGEIAMDEGDASCSFLMNPTSRSWSRPMIDRLDIDPDMLPPIRNPLDVLGTVTEAASLETGLASGTPVLVGGADYPVALLGSGTCRPGLVSDVTGTSSILTLIAPEPLLDPEISNVATVEGNWGAFALLESGGDAMRWARRALHEGKESYEQLVSRAAQAPAGSDGLFFLPFLTGERLGAHRNARAQFFGLGAAHGLSHINRAILEGVAFAGARHLQVMEKASGQKIERVIASGGGAKTEMWLRIKASIYGVPIVVPQEQECGILGSGAMGALATGQFSSLNDAVSAFVRYADEIPPNPAWQEKYAVMQTIFDKLYFNSQRLYDDLDRLAAMPATGE